MVLLGVSKGQDTIAQFKNSAMGKAKETNQMKDTGDKEKKAQGQKKQKNNSIHFFPWYKTNPKISV